VVAFALGFWATGALPAHVTALLMFLVVILLEIAAPGVIFAGFAAASLWLVFGGLVIAAAIETTRLGHRLARPVVAHLHGSYRRIIYGTVAICTGIAFLVPAAMGRIVILVPIFSLLAEQLGFSRRSNGRTGLMLAVTFGAFMPAFAILPANLPNMVLLGAAETLYGTTITYAEYLLVHLPVLGIVKAVVLAELICRLFWDRPTAQHAETGTPSEPWSGAERRLFAILILALVLWATDWLHGISAGWIALLAGCLCLMPGIGVLDTAAFETRIQLGPFVYVAGVLGMVSLIDRSGLADALGAAFLDWLPLEPGAAAQNFAALVGISTLTGMVVALPGIPAVLTPLAEPMADAAGLPLVSVLMTQVIGFSALLFPYQSPPLMVGLALSGIGLGPATRLSVALGATTLAVLAPLDFLWWRALGYLN
jgi:di/tricarboxylate transporter